MGNDGDAVARKVQVGFDPADAEVEGDFKGRQGVLGLEPAGATSALGRGMLATTYLREAVDRVIPVSTVHL